MASIDAQAAPADKPLAIASFNIRVPGIAVVISLFGIAAIARLLLASLDGFGVDMGTFRGWSDRLANDGPWNFYDQDFFSDYSPGYMYVLWLIGELNQIFHFSNDQYEYILKLPSIIADLGGAYLLYRMLDKEKPWLQLGATVLYLLFPAALLVGAFWGQVDSILSFFLLLSVYFIGRDRPVAGAVAFAIGFIIKPQAIAALPFLAFWIIRRHPLNLKGGEFPIPRVLIECTAYPLVVIFILILPFFTTAPWDLFAQLQSATTVDNYEVNSFWAYNFWNAGGLSDLGFRCDLPSACPDSEATKWLGMPTRYWGFAFFGLAIAAILYIFRNAKGYGFLALGVGMSIMAFYMFTTRMHERYVFPAFLPLLLGVALLHSRVLWAAFITTATVHFLNLYHVFGYYYLFNAEEEGNYPRWTRVDWLYDKVLEANVSFLGLDNILGWAIGVGEGPGRHVEAVQLWSIILLFSFLAMFPAAYFLAETRRDREKPLEGT